MRRWVVILAALFVAGCVTDQQASKEPSTASPGAALRIDERPEALGNFSGHSIYDTLYVSVRYGDKAMHDLLDEAVYTPRYVPLELKDKLISQFAAMGLFADVKPARADTGKPDRGYFADVTIAPTIELTTESQIKAYAGLGLVGVDLDTEFEVVTRTALQKLGATGALLVEDKYRLGGQANTSAYKQETVTLSAWPEIMGRVSPHVVNVIARSAIVDAAASKNAPASARQPAKSNDVGAKTAEPAKATLSAPGKGLPALDNLPKLPSLD